MGDKLNKKRDLFVFDLDGTLVHAKGETRGIPNYLIDEVCRLSEKAHIAIATGRRYRTALRDLETLPPMPLSIVHNGLVIKDGTGETLSRSVLPHPQALQAAQALEKFPVAVIYVCDGYERNLDYVYHKPSVENHAAGASLLHRIDGSSESIQSHEEILTFQKVPLVEVAAIGEFEVLQSVQKSIRRFLPKGYRAVLVKNVGADWSALEILPLNRSKWSGVNFVKEFLKAGRIIAVGDDENDIEMIQYADLGAVMAHAEPHVRAASARHLAGPEGLAEFLREF